MTGTCGTHRYSSGVFHDTPPGEAIGCCDAPRDDPIHTVMHLDGGAA